MFRIRHAIQSDVGILLKLAKMVHFINLPADKDAIAEKIRRSRASFTVRGDTPPVNANGDYTGPAGHSPQYMFVVDGSRWIPDPSSPESIDDGFGRANSIVRIAGPARLEVKGGRRAS